MFLNEKVKDPIVILGPSQGFSSIAKRSCTEEELNHPGGSRPLSTVRSKSMIFRGIAINSNSSTGLLKALILLGILPRLSFQESSKL